MPVQGRAPAKAGALPCGLICFSETMPLGCAVDSKKAFAVSFERSGMVFNTRKIAACNGKNLVYGGGASDAGDRVFSAS